MRRPQERRPIVNQKKQAARVRRIKLWAFAAAMLLLSVIGLFWFLRPTVSSVEKRNLTAFPAFLREHFWDGSYFSALSTWYADTYPLREGMIHVNQSLQAHYGIRSSQIVGETVAADAIPDPVAATPIPVSAAPAMAPEPSPTPEPRWTAR